MKTTYTTTRHTTVTATKAAKAAPTLKPARAVVEIIRPAQAPEPGALVLVDALVPIELARQFEALAALHNAR
jgi:hypothetical protein